MKSLLSVLAASAALMGAAGAVTIDFETFGDGEIVDTQIAGVTISATGGVGEAIAFDTGDVQANQGDDDLKAPFTDVDGGDPLSPGNILVISENDCSAGFCLPPDDAVGGTITVEFGNPQGVIFESVNVFDVTDGNASFSVELFDLSDVSLGSLVVNQTVGDNQFLNLVNDIDGVVGKLVFNFGGSGGIDDLTYTEVPIPGALLLMLTGLGLGRLASRKNKKAAA